MKRLTSKEVRQMFLDFFKEKGHKVEPSASLIPVDDPSLLWINSGVATLKKYFDGRVVPDNPRICNAQKAIRTNDIENVGITARHHTFFEMLGNFSVGDYFKREAIHWAWEFLTDQNWIGFEPDRLSVTIHPEDDEAFEIWNKEIGLPEERIIRLKENFWDIGEGPCGPNSEIFYDRGPEYGDDPNDPELYPGGENERYLEVWNLVFSQFNHNPDGSYTPLPKKNIDTGMGLERMVSVIQDGKTNFDTDLFLPIIQQIERISGKQYGASKEGDTAFKVISDHIRTVTFAISDGALPSNEGRGYVLRRLIRRAVRFAMDLGLEKPFMYELVPVVADIMGDFYDNLRANIPYVQKVIRSEEERFHETLHEGVAILSGLIKTAKERGETVLSGEEAFKLYDTFGFPVELTEEYAQKEGLKVDLEGFEKALSAQRERARNARQDVDSMHVQNTTLREITEESRFIGYGEQKASAVLTVMIKNNERITKAQAGEEVLVMLDQTPFYAESGGQVADIGVIENEQAKLIVKDVQKAPNGQNLHTVVVEKGEVTVGDQFVAKIDSERRRHAERNHSATHLLHQALKDVLGSHVNQAGSLVAPDRLRFDFSHFGKITEEELAQIEAIVNEKIWASLPVETMEKGLQEAKAMGAMALFGEKYGDIVRVVKIGDYSLELCGGCHVRNSAEIGLFKIVSEAGIGAGTRRIEAVTGKYAFDLLNKRLKDMQAIASELKTNLDGIPERINGLREQISTLEKENASLIAKLSQQQVGELVNHVRTIGGVPVLVHRIDGLDMNGLRTTVDQLKNTVKSGIMVLATAHDGKVNIVCGVTKDWIEKGFHAGKLVKEVAQRCGGGGGGRPDMAQAGGKNVAELDKALAFVPEWIEGVLSRK